MITRLLVFSLVYNYYDYAKKKIKNRKNENKMESVYIHIQNK